MAEKQSKQTESAAAEEAPASDRVAMLSLKADGTPDQVNPVIIGDAEAAVEAAKKQFAEQAIAAHEDVSPDKAEKLAAAAEKQAESVVKSLHEG